MTVQTDTLRVAANGNDVATTFSFSPIVISDADDLVVTKIASDGTETTLSRGSTSTTYSVTVAEYPGTGSITYPASGGTPLATGASIVMRRVLDLLQETDLNNQGPYNADTLETALDRLTWYDQQQQEEVDRSLKIPIGETPSAAKTTLPSVEDGEGYLYRNASDEYEISSGVVSVSVSPFMETVLDDTTAGAALTTLGISAFVQTMLNDAAASDVLTTLGVTAAGQAILDDASASAQRTTLGAAAADAPTFTTSATVSGATDPTLTVTDTTTPCSVQMKSLNTSVQIGSTTNHPVKLVYNNTEAVNIDTSGAIQTGATAAAAGYTGAGAITLPSGVGIRANNTAKVWGSLTVSGGTPTLNDSFGLSSITDLGVGSYSWNFTTNFGSVNYAAVTTAESNSGRSLVAGVIEAGAKTTSQCITDFQDAANANVEATSASIVCYGD